tara:strand:+ start:108 stop:341 length:234 start_codon:yes stop_codon:yes gene_type:complete
MEQYNHDMSRLKKIPILERDCNLAITTRGISEVVNSNNILETLKIMYCHHIISPAFRMLASSLITNLEKDIQNFCKK